MSSIEPILIQREMEQSYLDYSMSVIVGRAIPDVRDGLKPVQRRILFAMYNGGFTSDKPYRKSARIVGDVIGKYHPHGDVPIYEALVRLAQEFTMGAMLVDGQGNFGSIDGDPPAAMRYTEAKLAKIADYFLLNGLEENAVNFRDNYDNSEQEPEVIPASFPNILLNGATGVAVGMATNIAPHNLGEIIDACMLYLANPEVSIDELLEVIPAPDFPTGGMILADEGLREILRTGRGAVHMRGKSHIEEIEGGKQAIILDEIPYQVNKARLIDRIRELIKDKKIDGISQIRDESNKAGIRVFIELKRGVASDLILNLIASLTPFQLSFHVNNLLLHGGRPVLMPLPAIIKAFIEFRVEVITRRAEYRLHKMRTKAILLLGVCILLPHIDEAITIIKASADTNEALRELLTKEWTLDRKLAEFNQIVFGHSIGNYIKLNKEQAKAILEIKLQRLTSLERANLEAELLELVTNIRSHLTLLSSRVNIITAIKQELLEIKGRFATPRRSEIKSDYIKTTNEDLIVKEEVVVTVTLAGYIKLVKLSHYRAQKRGGKGRSGQTFRDEDIITHLFIASTKDDILFFSTSGKVYKIKAYKLPITEPQAKGKALINVFPLEEGEGITSVMLWPEGHVEEYNIVFATAMGNIRRNSLADFENVASNGKIAIALEKGDRLIGVQCFIQDGLHVFLSTKSGKSIRFPVHSLRIFKGRNSSGVRGISLSETDRVISLSILKGFTLSAEDRGKYLKNNDGESEVVENQEPPQEPVDESKLALVKENEEFILTVTERGYGKRSSSYEYRVTARGGVGVINIMTTKRNGKVVSSFSVKPTDQVILITDKGTLIRTAVDDIRITGRNAQGVILFKTNTEEKVVSVAKIAEPTKEEADQQLENYHTP